MYPAVCHASSIRSSPPPRYIQVIQGTGPEANGASPPKKGPEGITPLVLGLGLGLELEPEPELEPELALEPEPEPELALEPGSQ